MKIQEVGTRTQMKRFLDFPYQFYRDDPVWVPPLRGEVKSQFDPDRNPILSHCEYAFFTLEREGWMLGRIAAFIDRVAVEFWGEPIGFFGYYECVPDPAASRLLLEAAAGWLREREMKTIRGPWSFVSQEWGLVVEGFTPSPVIMAPYNPPYYAEHLEAFGLEKVKDLMCYAIAAADGYQIPERILRLTSAVAKRYGVRTRQLDMSRYDEEVRIIMELSNQSILGNWGYTPVSQAEADAMARDLKQIVHPKGVILAENPEGRPIGFAIALPDINLLLKGLNGRLLPFGWLKLLLGLPRLRSYRMFALGVIPEYQGKGIDSLIYRELYESFKDEDVRMEINYVLEDNLEMVNALRKLNVRPLRRYRIYERELLER